MSPRTPVTFYFFMHLNAFFFGEAVFETGTVLEQSIRFSPSLIKDQRESYNGNSVVGLQAYLSGLGTCSR